MSQMRAVALLLLGLETPALAGTAIQEESYVTIGGIPHKVLPEDVRPRAR